MLPAKHHHHDHWSSTAGDLVIAKLDATKNEIEGVDIEGFPTIKMFKKETNEEVEYVGRKKIYLFMFTCIGGLSYVDRFQDSCFQISTNTSLGKINV